MGGGGVTRPVEEKEEQRRGMERKGNVQRVLERVVHLENRSLVAAPVAVVWRREDGHDVFLIKGESKQGESVCVRVDEVGEVWEGRAEREGGR